MTIRILVGHVLDKLAELDADSISMVCTSPPYYSLRAYGTEAQVWGGDPAHTHEWGEPVISGRVRRENEYRTSGLSGANSPAYIASMLDKTHTVGEHAFCPCGAWRGELGSEPVPDCLALLRGEPPCSTCFVCHLVIIFRAVRRVLHPSGTCWLNLGDSYAGSGKGPTGHNGIGDQERRQGFTGGRGKTSLMVRRGDDPAPLNAQQRTPAVPGHKPKDLMLLPHRVALALQADGWWIRSAPPWLKKNAMPESVVDRPSTATEMLFLLTKRERYYWDPEAVRMAGESYRVKRPDGWDTAPGAHGSYHRNGREKGATSDEERSGRNRRNADWWFESLDRRIDEQRAYLTHLERIRREGGLLLDEDGEPLALAVNPRPFPDAHFAVFSPDLVLPCILASSSERGVCPTCGEPWRRITQETAEYAAEKARLRASRGPDFHMKRAGLDAVKGQGTGGNPATLPPKNVTLGWAPACRCPAAAPRPSVILDPFGGSGTVGLVADRLGRDAVLIELNPEYARMAERRIASDAPLLHGVPEQPPAWLADKQERPQHRRAIEIFRASSLTSEHLDAIRAAGITDTGKARVTQTGTGKNTAEVQRLAAEAKAALGGYYREFLTVGLDPFADVQSAAPVAAPLFDGMEASA